MKKLAFFLATFFMVLLFLRDRVRAATGHAGLAHAATRPCRRFIGNGTVAFGQA